MLKIPRQIVSDIVKQGLDAAPIEACGILAGTGGHVQVHYPMTNIDQSSEHFAMKPEEQFQAAKAIRHNKMDMLAIYHTHPETPARPSQEDIRLAFTPGVVYVIASLVDAERPVVKGFLIENGNVEEVLLETV